MYFDPHICPCVISHGVPYKYGFRCTELNQWSFFTAEERNQEYEENVMDKGHQVSQPKKEVSFLWYSNYIKAACTCTLHVLYVCMYMYFKVCYS